MTSELYAIAVQKDVHVWTFAILQGVAPLKVCISNPALQALVASRPTIRHSN